MIDLNLVRQHPEIVIGKTQKKDPSFTIQKLVTLDQEVRAIKVDVEDLRHKKNELAQQAKAGITEDIRQTSKEISATLKEKELELERVEKEFKDLYAMCPNLLADDVQDGGKEANACVSEFGTKPTFSFTPKNHVELGAINKLFDFEAAAKMTGTQFALYTGQGVRLVYALMMYMWNNNVKHGFDPILPPYLVNEQSLFCASNFPRFKDEVYAVKDDGLYLTPTSEVNLTNMYRDHIFMADQLPVRMTAWTSCFRREAGGYGGQERGLIRIHQFEKVELYTICQPQDAAQEQDRMLACAESILKSLNLHYRVMRLAAQDCSFASAKTYDIEVWMPGQGVYKEVSSVSNCTDFQARRAEMRYRMKSGDKTQLVNTLNASSLALPRLMVALIETYQQEDGSIAWPDVLKNVHISI